MEIRRIKLKQGYQQMQSYVNTAEINLGDIKLRYMHVTEPIATPCADSVLVSYVIRIVEVPNALSNPTGVILKSWVGKLDFTIEDVLKIIEEDRAILAQKILNGDNNEE